MSQPRRAGQRWRESAPHYILDCFAEPDSADVDDPYTVLLHPAYDGEVQYISATRSGGTYFGAMRDYEARTFRYRSGHKRIRWLDLPEPVRNAVVSRMED